MPQTLDHFGDPEAVFCRHCDEGRIRLRGHYFCATCDAPTDGLVLPTWQEPKP